MKKEKYLWMVSIFIVALIVGMPFYVSDVYAQSIAVVKNSGMDNVQDGDKGYIKRNRDIWTLIVNVMGGGAVTASQVDVNGLNFAQYGGSCRAAAGASYDCTYEYDYSSAALNWEREIPVVIDFYDASRSNLLRTVSTTVVADGSGPTISNLNFVQFGSTVNVNMDVEDQPTSCVGLKKIEIYDGGTNTLLTTIQGSVLEGMIDSQCGVNEITASVGFPAVGSLTKTGKVIAYDRLGHSTTATAAFTYDYNSPVIFPNTLRLGNHGTYIPSGAQVLDVKINISDDCGYADCLTVKATSSEWGWSDEEAVCTKINFNASIFECVWANQNIPLDETVSLQLSVSDGGNTVNQQVTKNFIIDSSAPVIDYFGTIDVGGGSYASPDLNTITVIFDEDESGIDRDSVRADLHNLDPNKYYTRPDTCEKSGSQWICYWNNVRNVNDYDAIPIQIVEAADLVGNDVDTTAAEASKTLILDDVKPVISDVEIYALGAEGPVTFYQSNDILQIDFKVTDEHGVVAKVDLSDIVTNFMGVVNDNGVLEASCIEDEEGVYDCTVLSPRIKSGYDAEAKIEFIFEDFAGNKETYTETFEIFGVSNEPEPDFWSLSSVEMSPSNGLGISTVPYVAQRVFYKISLKQETPGASIAGMSLDNCEGDVDLLDSYFMVNNMFGSTSPYVVLEVTPHEPTDNINVNCTLNLYNVRNNQAITAPEKELLELTVPFYTSGLESEQERLNELIRSEYSKAQYGIYGAIGLLKEIVSYLRIACGVLELVPYIQFVMDLYNAQGEVLRAQSATTPAAIATCYGIEPTKQATSSELYDGLKKFCDILACRASLLGVAGVDELDTWRGYIDSFYNFGDTGYGSFRKAFKFNTDPYSNFYMALIKLCVPAMIYNLDKLRQIQCRYVGCLKNEAASGVTTIEGCRQLKDYQTCKYFLGEFLAVLPLFDILNSFINQLQSALKDPAGLLGFALAIICQNSCGGSNLGTVLCSIQAWVFALLELANTIISLVNQGMALQQDYCTSVDVSAWVV